MRSELRTSANQKPWELSSDQWEARQWLISQQTLISYSDSGASQTMVDNGQAGVGCPAESADWIQSQYCIVIAFVPLMLNVCLVHDKKSAIKCTQVLPSHFYFYAQLNIHASHIWLNAITGAECGTDWERERDRKSYNPAADNGPPAVLSERLQGGISGLCMVLHDAEPGSYWSFRLTIAPWLVDTLKQLFLLMYTVILGQTFKVIACIF